MQEKIDTEVLHTTYDAALRSFFQTCRKQGLWDFLYTTSFGS